MASTANDLSVLTTSGLGAAEKIHIAMCRSPNMSDDVRRYLLGAMHHALIGVEQCRQVILRDIDERAAKTAKAMAEDDENPEPQP